MTDSCENTTPIEVLFCSPELNRDSLAMTRMNRTRRQRRLRPAAVEFEMTGLVIGGGCGMLAGLVVEIIYHPSAIIMIGGGMAGITLGSLIEIGRYQWRRHEQRKNQNP